MSTNNGGPAFPNCGQNYTIGMTLRDYLAGQVVVGLLMQSLTEVPGVRTGELIARAAYRLADHMLAARSA